MTSHLKIKESDLANNPQKIKARPSHPGLQDLDIWTKDQMFEWIKSRADMDELIINDPDDGSWVGR